MAVGGSGGGEDMGRREAEKVVDFVTSMVMRMEWDEELWRYNSLLLR